MRGLFTILFIMALSAANAQLIEGRWRWQNQELSGDAFFSRDAYLIKLYARGTDIRVSEAFAYIRQSGDTLIFSNKPMDANPDSVSYHLITSLTNTSMHLLDLQRNETNVYYNVNRERYELSPIRANEFYYSGTMTCAAPVNNPHYNNCLNFKSVSILSTIEEIEALLGDPYTTLEQGGIEYTVYLIPTEQESQPYLVISVNEINLLESIQLTGEKTNDDFSFSGIRLGDYYTLVENRLGPPSTKEQVTPTTQMWLYSPFPVSIEIENGTVSSIKLARG